MTNAPSPFLPNTTIRYAWDSTCLSALKTCPKLYYYQYIEGWSTSGESVHLRFGSEYHSALEEYDRAKALGATHTDALRTSVGNLVVRTADYSPDPETKAGKYKSRDALFRLVIDYLDKYEDDPARTYIKADGVPAVELSFSFELGCGPQASALTNDDLAEAAKTKSIGEMVKLPYQKQPYLLCGHLDRVVNYNDELFVMDRKTSTATLGSYYFAQYEPNNQMSLYSLAGQIVLNSPVKGVIIDAAQVLIDSSRFVRHITYRTPDQQEEWLQDLRYWLALAESYATEGRWPMNDTACDKFGGCRFREVCSKSPHVRDRFLSSHFIQLPEDQRWNPLKPR